MKWLYVLAAFLQAMYAGFNAHAVAFLAVFDAILHLRCDVAHVRTG
jgi:hypothetical protein